MTEVHVNLSEQMLASRILHFKYLLQSLSSSQHSSPQSPKPLQTMSFTFFPPVLSAIKPSICLYAIGLFSSQGSPLVFPCGTLVQFLCFCSFVFASLVPLSYVFSFSFTPAASLLSWFSILAMSMYYFFLVPQTVSDTSGCALLHIYNINLLVNDAPSVHVHIFHQIFPSIKEYGIRETSQICVHHLLQVKILKCFIHVVCVPLC